jgi:hypothetical protein
MPVDFGRCVKDVHPEILRNLKFFRQPKEDGNDLSEVQKLRSSS